MLNLGFSTSQINIRQLNVQKAEADSGTENI